MLFYAAIDAFLTAAISHVLCPMSYVLYPISYILCPISNYPLSNEWLAKNFESYPRTST